MLYIHLCNDCNRFHILNGHKSKCPICDATMQEMKLDFMHYVQMNEKEREAYKKESRSPRTAHQ